MGGQVRSEGFDYDEGSSRSHECFVLFSSAGTTRRDVCTPRSLIYHSWWLDGTGSVVANDTQKNEGVKQNQNENNPMSPGITSVVNDDDDDDDGADVDT